MNRIAIILALTMLVVIAASNVRLGQGLILPLPTMIERGAGVPWYITWIMVWLNVLCAAGLAAFLASSLLRNKR